VFLPPDFVESNIAVISSMDDSFKGSTGNTYIKTSLCKLNNKDILKTNAIQIL